MKLMDTSSLILFLDFIPEYEFLITFAENGEIIIITPPVEKEYYNKIKSFKNNEYTLENLINTEILFKEECVIEDIFKTRYFQLGEGEKSIISLGMKYKEQNKEYYCVLDDKNARKVANKLGLNVKGSIGLLLLLKDKNLLTNSKEVVNKIKNSNFRVSDNILERLNA